MLKERQFTYIGSEKYDITGLSTGEPGRLYQFVSFEVWNSRKHGIMSLPGSHGGASHYMGGELYGYSCPVEQWLCPIKRWTE